MAQLAVEACRQTDLRDALSLTEDRLQAGWLQDHPRTASKRVQGVVGLGFLILDWDQQGCGVVGSKAQGSCLQPQTAVQAMSLRSSMPMCNGARTLIVPADLAGTGSRCLQASPGLLQLTGCL